MSVLKAGLMAATLLTSSACVGNERPSPPVPITNTPGARQTSNSSTVDRGDASAQLAPTSGSTVTGQIRLTMQEGGLRLVGTVMGLAPNSTHGIHVHENGDCSAADASSAGEHFNPQNKLHGGVGPNTHVGDLGNLSANRAGVAYLDILVPDATLRGGANNIAGKAIVVHAGEDDFKTQPSGNSGARVACGAIIVAAGAQP